MIRSHGLVTNITDHLFLDPENTAMTSVLTQTAQSELLARATLRTEAKGAVLFRRGDPSLGVYLVRKGSIRLRLELGGEKAIVDRIVTCGAIVGLPATLAGQRYSLTASTLEDCELAFVERQRLLELISSKPSIGVELVRTLGEEVVKMRDILASSSMEETAKKGSSATRAARTQSVVGLRD